MVCFDLHNWRVQLSIFKHAIQRVPQESLKVMKIWYWCLVHLPRQNIFCPGQIWNCPGQNFCPGLKSPFFTFKSYSKWNFLIGRVSKNHFHLQMLILNNFGNQKMDFLTLDKIFVLDNLNIVLDKKYFVRADGQGIYLKKVKILLNIFSLYTKWKDFYLKIFFELSRYLPLVA